MASPQQKKHAQEWFEHLRDQICAAFEKIEQHASTLYPSTHPLIHEKPGVFSFTPWERKQNGASGHFGGGVMGMMKGRVFEKVGVNVSTVFGNFEKDFQKEVSGAEKNDGAFWASGISLVAHMHSPKIPAIHMNTRMIETSETWFGGGSDLNTAFPDAIESKIFHDSLKKTCDHHDPDYYAKFKKWCDEYFYIKHRKRARGEGGIFYDRLQSGNWENDFAFTKDVGMCFLSTYPHLVQEKMPVSYTEEDRKKLFEYRGLYAEFNLLYDRGTRFGLMTDGNIDAILMSLPPIAAWN